MSLLENVVEGIYLISNRLPNRVGLVLVADLSIITLFREAASTFVTRPLIDILRIGRIDLLTVTVFPEAIFRATFT